MNIFVYYSDGYPDDGGLGLEKFDNKKDAENFITYRMNQTFAGLDSYTIIQGKILEKKAVSQIKRISIGN